MAVSRGNDRVRFVEGGRTATACCQSEVLCLENPGDCCIAGNRALRSFGGCQWSRVTSIRVTVSPRQSDNTWRWAVVVGNKVFFQGRTNSAVWSAFYCLSAANVCIRHKRVGRTLLLTVRQLVTQLVSIGLGMASQLSTIPNGVWSSGICDCFSDIHSCK